MRTTKHNSKCLEDVVPFDLAGADIFPESPTTTPAVGYTALVHRDGQWFHVESLPPPQGVVSTPMTSEEAAEWFKKLGRPLPACLQPAYALVKVGTYWVLQFGKKKVQLQDSVGIRYISQLLHGPHKQMSVLELMRRAKGSPMLVSARNMSEEGQSDGEEEPYIRRATRQATDSREGITALIQRKQHLEEDIQRAVDDENSARIEELQDEYYRVTEELEKAKNNRTETGGDAVEKARVAVWHAISRAFKQIRKAGLPEAADYLERHIDRGIDCVYRPGMSSPTWVVVFDLTT